MSLQSAFEKFNDKIRIDFDVKKELKDKCDILLNKLRNDDELPSFTEFNQGSYAMYRGIEGLWQTSTQHANRLCLASPAFLSSLIIYTLYYAIFLKLTQLKLINTNKKIRFA